MQLISSGLLAGLSSVISGVGLGNYLLTNYRREAILALRRKRIATQIFGGSLQFRGQLYHSLKSLISFTKALPSFPST